MGLSEDRGAEIAVDFHTVADGLDLFSHVRSWSSLANNEENHWPSDGRIQENSVPDKV